jgi:membrane protein DedA with SNARE-associated domain
MRGPEGGNTVTLTAELLMGLFVAYGYWIVFTAILLDNAGFPIPGELLLLAFGMIAREGYLDPLLGLAVAATAALMGDSVGYWLGRLGGTRLLARIGRAPRFKPGYVTLVFGRFVIGARMLLCPLAGASRMAFPRFVACDGLGCIVWAGVFILVGYASGMRLEVLQQSFQVVGYAAQAVLVAGLATWGITRLVLQRRRRAV